MVQVDNPTMKALMEAAASIAVERQRLNNTFEQIQAAVKAYMPSVKLLDDGTLMDYSNGNVPKPVGPPEEVPSFEPLHPTAEEQVTAADQRAAASMARAEAYKKDIETLEARLALFILDKSPARPSAVDTEFLETTLPEGTVVTINLLNKALTALKDDKTVKRERDGRLIHRNWSPKVTEAKPAAATRGSGSRHDTVPKPAATEQTTAYKHAYVEGKALCGYSGRRNPDATQECSLCKAKLAEMQAEPKPAPKPVAKPTASDGTLPEGLARSPVPRSQMRIHQREAELKLDKVVEWAMTKGNEFDPATCMVELGVNAKKTTSKSNNFYYKSGGFFGNESQAGQYFATLEQRGVFELVGYRHPEFKKDWAARGRTSAYFKPGRFFPKAEPAPPTQMSVRESLHVQQPTVVVPLTEERIRDAAIKLCKANGQHDCSIIGILEAAPAINTSTTRSMVRSAMKKFIAKGMFKEIERDTAWVYIEPTEEGAAARIDRERAPQRAVQAVAEAVAGTGRGLRAANKEVQLIINAAVKKWGDKAVETAGNNHWKINLPDGSNVRIASTPNQRGLLKDKAKLRKAGLALA